MRGRRGRRIPRRRGHGRHAAGLPPSDGARARQIVMSGSRIAVVTGAAGGIGAAVVEAFLADGWTVHGLDRSAPATGGGLVGHACDVTDDEGLRTLAQSIGQVDALVPAAGINLRPHDNAAEKLTLDAWD